jgi:hypothetical protein
VTSVMRPVGKVSSSLLLVSAAIIVLAAAAGAATPPNPSRATCLPPGAHTLAADRAVRVFSWHGAVYGCVMATGARQKLGGATVCNLPPGRVAPVRVTRDIVAFGLESCGVDTGSSAIVVRNLAIGTRLADVPAATLALGPESYVSVVSLVLRGDGAVGWIARDNSLVGKRPTTYEVHRFIRGKSSRLGSGTAIDPGSLRLVGARMTWRDGSARRSAGL